MDPEEDAVYRCDNAGVFLITLQRSNVHLLLITLHRSNVHL